MNLADFASQHNVQRDAVAQYIRRHPEEFRGHTSNQGKKLILDEVAIELLEKKYPLRPIEVVEDVATLRELAEAHKALAAANAKLAELQGHAAALEATKILLEDREQQLVAEREARAAAEKEILRLSTENAVAAAEVERLKNRGLFDRIRNR